MRKGLGLLGALVLLVPLGVSVAAPAVPRDRYRRTARHLPARDVRAAVAEAQLVNQGEHDGHAVGQASAAAPAWPVSRAA